jgi:hypothetical protein
MTVEELSGEASKLPERERGFLAAEILSTLKPGAYDVSDEEVLRRVEESKSGSVRDISFDELKAGLKDLSKS